MMAIGIFDYLAVLVFISTSVVLIKFMKDKLNLTNYIILILGLFIITFAGTFKATNKLIIGINGNDIEWMRLMFFPLQAIGFICLFISIHSLILNNFRKHPKNIKTLSIVSLSLLMFLTLDPSKIYKPICQVLLFVFNTLVLVSLAYISYKINKKKLIFLYIGSETTMILMSVIGFTPNLNEWVKEGFNTTNQIVFFIAILLFSISYNKNFKIDNPKF